VRTPPIVAVRRLATARSISVTGSMAAYAALIDLVYRRTNGSTIYLSLTVLLTIGAVGLLAPLGGALADRADRKRVLVGSDLAGALLFLCLAVVGAPWLLLVVAFFTAVAETPFRTGSIAAVPSVVEDERLIAKANGWIGVGTNIGITLGPALGGVLVAWIGAGPVFVVNALSFVVSAALVWSIDAPFGGSSSRTVSPVVENEDGGRADGSFASGFRFLRRDRVLVVLTLAWMVLLLAMGLGIVADRPLADVFDAGSVGFGLMLGLWGLGSVAGSWAAGRASVRMEPVIVVAGFVVAGAAGLLIGVAGVFWLILVANVIWGFGDAATVVAEQGIIQRRTPDVIRARVIGANESLVHAALVAGFLIATPAIAAVGPQAAYAVMGAAAVVAGVLASTVIGAARGSSGDVRSESPTPTLLD
jgi:predicted MFS family arabinose efflux permease